jgi:hypothetical protein
MSDDDRARDHLSHVDMKPYYLYLPRILPVVHSSSGKESRSQIHFQMLRLGLKQRKHFPQFYIQFDFICALNGHLICLSDHLTHAIYFYIYKICMHVECKYTFRYWYGDK